MGARLQTSLAVLLALVLSACATQSNVVERPAPGPAVATPTPPAAATKRCTVGNGVVVRLGDAGGAKAAADTMNGGVLGGVLADNGKGSGGQQHPATSGSGHDIYVQMDDGRKLIVNQHDLGGIAVGSHVGIDEGCRARLLR